MAAIIAFGLGAYAMYAQARVRTAAAAEREVLLSMVLAYLIDAAGDILPCPENVELYGGIFDRYLSGEAEGVALFAVAAGEVVGFTMAGEFPLGFLTSHGKAAMGWGTYVVPGERQRGHAGRLRRALDRRLRAMGFDAILGGYAPKNAAAEASLRGSGFAVYQVLGAKRLRE